jgi:hypothetical protein
MWHRRVVLTATLIALLLLCGRAGTAPLFPALSPLENQGLPTADLARIHVYRDWHPPTGEEKGQASSDDLTPARGTRQRPRDPYPGWYEWRLCLRGYNGPAPVSMAPEDPLDEPYRCEWPFDLQGGVVRAEMNS